MVNGICSFLEQGVITENDGVLKKQSTFNFENKLKDMIKLSMKAQSGTKDSKPEDLSYLG